MDPINIKWGFLIKNCNLVETVFANSKMIQSANPKLIHLYNTKGSGTDKPHAAYLLLKLTPFMLTMAER